MAGTGRDPSYAVLVDGSTRPERGDGAPGEVAERVRAEHDEWQLLGVAVVHGFPRSVRSVPEALPIGHMTSVMKDW